MKIFVCERSKFYIGEVIFKIIVIIMISFSLAFGIVVRGFGTSLFIEAATIDDGKIIILDAGHGGEDAGAIGANGAYEKDLNLAIALEIGELLSKEGYTVLYTRIDDRMLYSEECNIKGMRKQSDLENRVKRAEEYPEALFISIHMNSYGDSKYSGLQVYYSENSSDSRLLASVLQNNVRESLQNDNKRTIKSGERLYLLKKINNPAVIIECGFLTNTDECQKLSSKEYQKELSFSIVCGIIKYMEEK